MASYLLTWNPNVFAWPFIDEDIVKIDRFRDLDEKYILNWSVISSKPAAGDDFYLMVVGFKPVNGIVGLGKICGNAYTLDFQNRRKYVDIEFHKLLNPNKDMIIELPVLESVCPEQLWTPQCSGIRINDEYETFLRSLWK